MSPRAPSPRTPSPSGQMRTAPGPSTVGVSKIALPLESQQKGTASDVLPFWSSFPPISYPSSYRITAQGVESSIVGRSGSGASMPPAKNKAPKSGPEPLACPLRVINRALQGLQGLQVPHT